MEVADLELFTGLPPRIDLKTRVHRPIDNYVALPASEDEIHGYEALRAQDWTRGRPPGGGYNCYGHVFAARRCTIRSAADVDHILRDDGYAKVSPMHVATGDVVLYRLSGEAAHVAVVVQVNPQVQLLSKWNEAMGEDVHPLGDYLGDLLKLAPEVEYWRFEGGYLTTPPTED